MNYRPDIYAQKALELIEKGESLFITGKAGTGKTMLLEHIVQKNRGRKKIAVLAPTGVAAKNAHGVTIHSFLHVPLVPYIPGIRNRHLYSLSKSEIEVVKIIDTILFDEISMVRCDLLDAVDDILRHYRKIDKPFGGIQIIMFGDLYQLMPVAKDEDQDKLYSYYNSLYFFDSKVIEKLKPPMLELENVYRQTDSFFVHLLNHIRVGDVKRNEIKELDKLYSIESNIEKGTDFIRLTTHKYKARIHNQKKLEELTGTTYSFSAKKTGFFPRNEWPTPYFIKLKKGARVMFVRNDTGCRNFVNGTLGTVTDLSTDTIIVKTDEGKIINVEKQNWELYTYRINKKTKEIETEVCGTFIQYPLKLAWAVTIHKSQGLTFDKVVIDAGKAFTFGQVYVALSRCRTFEGIALASKISANSIKTDPTVTKYLQTVNRIVVSLDTHKTDIAKQSKKKKPSILSLNVKDSTFAKIANGSKNNLTRAISDKKIASLLLSQHKGNIYDMNNGVCPLTANTVDFLCLKTNHRHLYTEVRQISFKQGKDSKGKSVWVIVYNLGRVSITMEEMIDYLSN